RTVDLVCSSRRRHTRAKRDWSSDVCSSDLIRIVDDVDAGDGGRPRGRLDPGGQDSQCRGFPGTVGSQKSEDFAVLDGEVDPLECVWHPATVLLAQFRYLDHGISGRLRSYDSEFL